MPINDLNIEFEDEEEAKEKKSEAVHLDVDLEFQSQTNIQRRPVHMAPALEGRRPEAVVRPIESARPMSSPVAKAHGTQPKVMGATALKMEPVAEVESQELIELREKMRQVELNAEVKVQVAEFKTEYLTEMLSDMKLMEHQIGQLLLRINAKHPDLKNEALMIKKILADFTSKKRK